MVVIAAIFGLLAVINLVQVVIGRQVFGASRSIRPPAQLRRESALAAVAMAAAAVTFLGFVRAIVIAAVALWGIFEWRLRSPPPEIGDAQRRMPEEDAKAPGWYPHPERPGEEWYWNGDAWTESRWATAAYAQGTERNEND